MTEFNTQSPTDIQTEKIIDSLKSEIASLDSRLKEKEERRQPGYHSKSSNGEPRSPAQSLQGFRR